MSPNPPYIITSNQPLDNATLPHTNTKKARKGNPLFIFMKSMVSLQTSFSQGEKKLSPILETFSSNKRKWQDEGKESKNDEFHHELKLSKKEQVDHIELNLDAPLPLEWQRCLDIKSGQIHFYNTRTHERTSKDPRSAPTLPPPSSSHPTLNLELNLNLKCSNNAALPRHELGHEDQCKYADNNIEPALDINRKEMVAAVCVKCHMLVMMCKASPSCPNCKFVHDPQGQTFSCAFSLPDRTELRLLCCKD